MSMLSDAIYMDDVPKTQWKQYGIGKGYRSVYYMTDHEKRGRIALLGFDTNGDRKTYVFPWKSNVAYNVKYKTDEKDLYGHYVARKYFNSKWERDNYVKNAAGLSIVECLKPEQEFLHYMFDDVSLDEDFNKQKVRIHYFDIETEISDRFEKPADARNRINMMTIYDNFTEKFYTWSLDHAEVDFKEDPLKDYPKDKFVFFEFHDNESELLEHFLSWYEDNYPDVNFGWNTKAYDIPYLVRRIENVLGNGAASRLSPFGKYFIKDVNHDNKRADVGADIEVNIPGLFIADGLVLYRDKFGISKPDGGFTLDNIGEHEGCGNKIHYDGTLRDLYMKDYQRFYEYNVRDVDLAKRIDDKCKMIRLARLITSFGLSDHNQIYGSINYLINSLTSFAKTQMNGVVFNSYVAERMNFDQFEGAFVFPTIPGVYRGGIGTIDFASLYPTAIRCGNISPETYVGKVLIQRKDDAGNLLPINKKDEPNFNIFDDSIAKSKNIVGYQLMLKNGQIKQVTLDWLRDMVNTKCIYNPNNTLFLKHEVKTGIVPLWCKFYYANRKTTKKKMLACYHTLHNPEEVAKLTEEQKKKIETDEENYNSTQLGFKSMINSIYGCMGNKFSAIADPNLAQSVTRLGKFCNTSTQAFMRTLFEELYNVPKDYIPVVGMDTDSIFCNLKCISDEMIKKYGLGSKVREWPKKYRKELWDTMSNLVETRINPYVRNLVHDYCKSNKHELLTYELEYMSSDAIYESKKHYLAHLIFNEGDYVDYDKCTGIELKKTVVPKEMKKFLAEIYDGVVNKYWTESEYQNYICDLYDRFSKFSVDEIAFWRGYNSERDAIGFLQMAVGTTGTAKAVTYYNQIIDKMGLGKKYETIEVGNKIRQVCVKPSNRYGIDTLAYKPGQWPKEFNEVFEVDYKTMFKKIIRDPLKRFREACHFEDTDPSKQAQFDIFSI